MGGESLADALAATTLGYHSGTFKVRVASRSLRVAGHVKIVSERRPSWRSYAVPFATRELAQDLSNACTLPRRRRCTRTRNESSGRKIEGQATIVRRCLVWLQGRARCPMGPASNLDTRGNVTGLGRHEKYSARASSRLRRWKFSIILSTQREIRAERRTWAERYARSWKKQSVDAGLQIGGSQWKSGLNSPQLILRSFRSVSRSV